MKNFFLINYLISAMSGYKNPEYYNLTEEEKADMDFVDECLYESDEKISTASTKIMFLVMEYSARSEDNLMSDEEFFSRKYEITKDLTKEEKDVIDCFGRSLINTMGIYSEERIHERRLKKERNDK